MSKARLKVATPCAVCRVLNTRLVAGVCLRLNNGGKMQNRNFVLAALLIAGLAMPAHAKKQPPLVTLGELGASPSNIETGVKAAAQGYLKDPYSAQYQIGSVFPGYCKEGWLKGNGVSWKGWAVNVLINGRNSYGGYTGYQPHTVLFVGDQAVRIMEGENFGAYGPAKGLLGGGAGVCQIIKE